MIWALGKTEISIQRRRKKIRTFIGSESRIKSPHPEPMGPLSFLLTEKHILTTNVTIPGGPAKHQQSTEEALQPPASAFVR